MGMLDVDKHVGIIGETQSGKTVLSNLMFQNTGGIYVDFEDVGEIDSDVEVYRTTSFQVLRRHLTRGKRVKYVPAEQEDARISEINGLWNAVKRIKVNVPVYGDEVQEYGGSQTNAFDRFCTRGLKYGPHLVHISQRPAKISNTMGSQTPRWIFFDIGDMEQRYFNEYSLPYDSIKEALNGAPDHSFVVYLRGDGVSGPYRLDLS